jgi:hypothetical protein
MEPIGARVHAVFLSNDDGSEPVQITPAEVALWVAEANTVLGVAGIVLDFDPGPGSGDWEFIQNSLLNEMYGVDHPQWAQQKAMADVIAAQTPDKVVVFFRWGPGPHATGMGFSWSHYDFVAMPGFSATGVCSVQNIGLLSHEVGHYLGLPHTFGWFFDTVVEATTHFVTNGSDPALFDGDGRDDTLPDPFTFELQCDSGATTIDLAGTVLTLPRTNTMSYYHPDVDVSPSQAWTARQVLAIRSGQPLDVLVRGEAPTEEMEAAVPAVSAGFWAAQGMSAFDGKWSGDSQLFWIDGAIGDTLTTALNVPSSGYYDIYAGFSAAPDYGTHSHTINGQLMEEVDLYAGSVLATGPVWLGRAHLEAGANSWVVEITGTDPRAVAVRYGFGLDYALAVPVTPWIDAGASLPGASGPPLFVGSGSMAGGSLNDVALTNAAPSSIAGLFIALSSTPTPFKGGLLLPGPLIIGPQLIVTDPSGGIALQFPWPAGAPPLSELWLQWAIQDSGAIKGVALSNALVGMTP